MPATPTFSVVIPTFNRAHLIERTLASVFAQRHPAAEVIVVDDHSTDATRDVLEPYAREGRIRLIVHDRNRERAAARNTGLDAATADYVTFLDSDDVMYADNLADAAAHAVQTGSKIFHNAWEVVDAHGNLVSRPRFPSVHDPRRAIVEGNFVSCIGGFLHRDLYQRFRFDPEPVLTATEDWDFWIRVFAEHPHITRIDRVNSGVLHHPGQSTSRLDLERLRRRLEYVQDKVRSDPDLRRAYEPHLERLEAHCLLFLAGAANTGQQHAVARAYALRAASRHLRHCVSLKFARVLGRAVMGSRPRAAAR